MCNNCSTLLPHYIATKTDLTQFKCGLLKLFVHQRVAVVSFVQLNYMMLNNYCFTCSLVRILTYSIAKYLLGLLLRLSVGKLVYLHLSMALFNI